MEGLFVLLLLFLIAIALLTLGIMSIALMFITFGHGLFAFRLSLRRIGPETATLRFLGINLCEPLLTSLFNILFFVAVMVAGEHFGFHWFYPGPFVVFVLLLPMASLLLPKLGWVRPTVPIYRNLNGRIFALGIARIGVTSLILFPLFFTRLIWLSPMAFVVGVWLLWYSNRWGRQLLQGPLSYPYAPQTPLAVSSNSSTLPAPQLLVQSTQPAVFPRLPALSAPLFCPLCHTPATLEDADCISISNPPT
ncbi:MAG: hypothetical protein ACLFVO_05020 [Chloroflexaceae bacterium]